MRCLLRFSGLVSAALMMIILSPSLQSFPPAEAIRSSSPPPPSPPSSSSFKRSPLFRNTDNTNCPPLTPNQISICDPSLVHVTLTLDLPYLRGSIAAVNSILHHTNCPENIFFHFITSFSTQRFHFQTIVKSTFPNLKFKLYTFNPSIVQPLISTSVREALEQPLNYARTYLATLLSPCIRRVIYLDSDLILVDDITKLWNTKLGPKTIGAPEYCHANFSRYFTSNFWSDSSLNGTFIGRRPCYFNTGVMVIDLVKWRAVGYIKKIEKWMEIQTNKRIYELGSLPPFLLVFAGDVAPIEHRWNQHGLGGDNVKGSCRDLHPGPVSLLHWSGSGKPWVRLDSRSACPLDSLWAPYDLYVHPTSRK